VSRLPLPTSTRTSTSQLHRLEFFRRACGGRRSCGQHVVHLRDADNVPTDTLRRSVEHRPCPPRPTSSSTNATRYSAVENTSRGHAEDFAAGWFDQFGVEVGGRSAMGWMLGRDLADYTALSVARRGTETWTFRARKAAAVLRPAARRWASPVYVQGSARSGDGTLSRQAMDYHPEWASEAKSNSVAARRR